MTAGPAGPFDRPTLARWAAQLAPLRPLSFWVGELELTHVEALVRVERPSVTVT